MGLFLYDDLIPAALPFIQGSYTTATLLDSKRGRACGGGKSWPLGSPAANHRRAPPPAPELPSPRGRSR